jgi:hypothetical protein
MDAQWSTNGIAVGTIGNLILPRKDLDTFLQTTTLWFWGGSCEAGWIKRLPAAAF